MSITLIDFVKDEAAQELLGHAGITESYELIIQRNALDILRESVPECEIESIKFLGPGGCNVGGMPIEEGSSKIIMQELKISFDLEITVRAPDDDRHRLTSVFDFDCCEIDKEPKQVFNLAINKQEGIEA